MKNKFAEENSIRTNERNPLQFLAPIHHAVQKAFQQQPNISTAPPPQRIKSSLLYESLKSRST